MMEKRNKKGLVDEYIKALEGMEMPHTDEFFYTRLRARMERKERFPVKPVWVIATLLLFISINSLLLIRQQQYQKAMSGSVSSLDNVAETYNLGVSSTY